MTTFSSGDFVRVASVRAESAPGKLALVGQTGQIIRESKIGNNQFTRGKKWVLDLNPGIWFTESELVKHVQPNVDSVQIKHLKDDINVLQNLIAAERVKTAGLRSTLQFIRQDALGIVGTVDNYKAF